MLGIKIAESKRKLIIVNDIGSAGRIVSPVCILRIQ